MKKLLFISIVGLVLSFSANSFGQTDDVYSNYHLNGSAVNPAFCGTTPNTAVSLDVRTYNLLLPGINNGVLFSHYGPLLSRNLFWGYKLFGSQAKYEGSVGGLGTFGFKVKSNWGVWSFGGSLGAIRKEYFLEKLSKVDSSLVLVSNKGITLFTSEFGFLNYNHKRFFGLSVTHLTDLIGVNDSLIRKRDSRVRPHVYFTFGYRFGRNFALIPYVNLLKVGGFKNQSRADVYLAFAYKDIVEIGFGTKSNLSNVSYIRLRKTNKWAISLNREVFQNVSSTRVNSIVVNYYFNTKSKPTSDFRNLP